MPSREDCLKRVSSEPLLSVQEKGALLKRKLSLLEQDVIVNEDGRNKLKKQGGKHFTALIRNIYLFRITFKLSHQNNPVVSLFK